MANLKRKERRNLTVLMATERAMYNKKKSYSELST
jgi:hypothetical protein